MIAGSACDDLAALVAARAGLDVPLVYRNKLAHALAIARRVLGTESDRQVLQLLDALPDESDAWQQLIRCLTVRETRFLRQRDWFARIESEILLPLIRSRRATGQRRLRIWSAGCATGEEAYSIALLTRRLLPDALQWDLQVVGTDLDGDALRVAREAVYGAWALRETDPATRVRDFHQLAPNRFRVAAHIRQLVRFQVFNLAAGTYPDPARGLADFDLILCRNVMMYFSASYQDKVAAGLARCLAPGGWLAVAPTEAMAARFRPLAVVRFPNAIFFRAVAPTDSTRPPKAPPLRAKLNPTAHARRRTLSADPPASPVVAAAAPTPVSQARELADGGRLCEARDLCRVELAHDPMNTEANLLLATVCAELGDDRGAVEAARRAAYLDSDSAAAHFLMGTALVRLGQAQQGRRSLATARRLLDVMPDDAPVGLGTQATAGLLRATLAAYLAQRAELSSGAAQ